MQPQTYKRVLDCHPSETVCVSLDGEVDYSNSSAERLFGLDGPGANFGRMFQEPAERVLEVIHRCAGSSSWQPITMTLAQGRHAGLRLMLRCRGIRDVETGEVVALIVSDENRLVLFEEHRRLIAQLNGELAEQQRTRQRLDDALANETRLHGELIHRVKNNLSLLGALIRARASATDDANVRAALDDIQSRVLSIGLVHELLDRNNEIDVVDCSELLERLCDQMETSICPPGVTIRRTLTPLPLHVSEATPLALLVNELVTNSLKHAFKGRETGTVDIALKRNGVDKIEVHVADDGAGFEAAEHGHGGRIVEALAQQLGGELSVRSDGGTAWQLIFAPSDVADRAESH